MEQTKQELLEQFAAVIRELTVLAGDIAQVETAKANAAAEKRHYLLDGYIQKEQAYILKLRGLEQHRMNLAKELGWESLTFRQILEQASLRQSELLRPLFDCLDQQLKELEQARNNSERIIHVRIHEIQTLMAQRQGSSYDNTGNVNLPPSGGAKLKDRYV